jgi:hypothetical protein
VAPSVTRGGARMRRSPVPRALGRDDRAQKLDRAQDRRLRLVADRHLHEITVVAKNLVLNELLLLAMSIA